MSQEGETIIDHEYQTPKTTKSKMLLSEGSLFHESRRESTNPHRNDTR